VKTRAACLRPTARKSSEPRQRRRENRDGSGDGARPAGALREKSMGSETEKNSGLRTNTRHALRDEEPDESQRRRHGSPHGANFRAAQQLHSGGERTEGSSSPHGAPADEGYRKKNKRRRSASAEKSNPSARKPKRQTKTQRAAAAGEKQRETKIRTVAARWRSEDEP
jgi:hypothetical protein